ESSDVTSGPTSVGSTDSKRPRRGRRIEIIAATAVLVLGGVAAYAKLRSPAAAANAATGAATPTSAAPASDAEVIAILPFVSIGATSGNSYLAEGLTNALAGSLSS